MGLIVAFVGSPRKNGNTDNLVDEILKGAEFKGIEIKKFYLNDMNIKGCQGCLYCRKNPICIIKDDMAEVYEYIKKADYIVLGSPVYICQVSSQIKLLLDRLYPLTEINKSKHTPRFGEKDLITVFTQAAPFSFVFKKYFKYTVKHLKGMGLIHHKMLISTKSFQKDFSLNNKKIMKKAYRIGISLVNK